MKAGIPLLIALAIAYLLAFELRDAVHDGRSDERMPSEPVARSRAQ